VSDSVSGLIQMNYDNLNRLTQEVTPQGVVTYTYDVLGRRTSMSANGLPPVVYQYDVASRLTQVAQGSQVVELGYDVAGRRTSLTYPNGTTTSYFYDNTSHLSEILHQGPSGIIEDVLYTYDAAGNRISFSRTSPQADLPQPIQAAYNAANQTVQFNTDTLTYDTNGNLTSDGTTTYTWDARNRLTSMTGPSVNASFVYDGLGRRVNKTISGEETQYVYDGNDIVAEIQNGVISATYLRSLGMDKPFLRSSAVAEFYYTDALGSVMILSDQTGTMQTTYAYDPFGNATLTGASANPFQYTGRENDGTGLYYYRARYYSPAIRRFLSEDPLYSPLYNAKKCLGNYNPSVSRYIERDRGLSLLLSLRFGLYSIVLGFKPNPQQLHLYTYANDNPVNMVDPMGLLCGPQSPGCDRVWDFNPCATKCCNEHDDCYCRSMGWCDESSWYSIPGGPDYNWDCDVCNTVVANCLWDAATSGSNGRGSPPCQ
jgi:RHS repeat-associated protein